MTTPEIYEIICQGSPDHLELVLDELTDISSVYSQNNGHTVLHDIVLTGEVEKVKVILKRKPNLEIRSRNQKFTPLHSAVVNDHVAVIEALLDAGSNIEATASDGLTSLHLAAMRNHRGATAILLSRGASIHATEVNGATALHGAAFYGHTEVVRHLLEKGADPDRKDSHGSSPRSLAQMKGHSEILRSMGGPGKTSAPSLADRVAALEGRARNGLIVSESLGDHFANIVREMEAIGATRNGSRGMASPEGTPLVVDIYVLPSGKTLLAGYPSTR